MKCSWTLLLTVLCLGSAPLAITYEVTILKSPFINLDLSVDDNAISELADLIQKGDKLFQMTRQGREETGQQLWDTASKLVKSSAFSIEAPDSADVSGRSGRQLSLFRLERQSDAEDKPSALGFRIPYTNYYLKMVDRQEPFSSTLTTVMALSAVAISAFLGRSMLATAFRPGKKRVSYNDYELELPDPNFNYLAEQYGNQRVDQETHRQHHHQLKQSPYSKHQSEISPVHPTQGNQAVSYYDQNGHQYLTNSIHPSEQYKTNSGQTAPHYQSNVDQTGQQYQSNIGQTAQQYQSNIGQTAQQYQSGVGQTAQQYQSNSIQPSQSYLTNQPTYQTLTPQTSYSQQIQQNQGVNSYYNTGLNTNYNIGSYQSTPQSVSPNSLLYNHQLSQSPSTVSQSTVAPVTPYTQPARVNNPGVQDTLEKLLKSPEFPGFPYTYDPFYGPRLSRIDSIFAHLNITSEVCKERMVCSVYKSPTLYSPVSELLSHQISVDVKDLKTPSSPNPEVLRFFRYLKAAKDGTTNENCIDKYPDCEINTDNLATYPMINIYNKIDDLVNASS